MNTKSKTKEDMRVIKYLRKHEKAIIYDGPGIYEILDAFTDERTVAFRVKIREGEEIIDCKIRCSVLLLARQRDSVNEIMIRGEFFNREKFVANYGYDWPYNHEGQIRLMD